MSTTTIRYYINSIFSSMADIEFRHNKLFHEVYPELEADIFKAIDSGSEFELANIVKRLDDLK